MIPRPVNRPRPIPFDAPLAERSSSPVQPVNWAATTPPATVLSACEPLSGMAATLGAAQASGSHNAITPRLSPVNVQNKLASVPRDTPAASAPLKGPAATDASARFVGQGSLSVRSSVTGRHYRFQGHGDCQKVDKNDLMLLRRIADLVVS